MNWRRLVYCRLLGLHFGNIETVTASVDVPYHGDDGLLAVNEAKLSIRLLPCSECGGIKVLDVEPRGRTLDRLGISDEAR